MSTISPFSTQPTANHSSVRQSGSRSQRPKRWYAIILLCLILLSVGLEYIEKFYTPHLPTATLTVPPTNQMGINYYHESMGYLSRTDTEIDSDLGLIQQVTNKIKVAHNPYMNAGHLTAAASLAIVQNIVRKAKARKMYVVWTENNDTVTFTDKNWSDYAQKVIADAAAAHAAGADEFLVGNEISLHTNGDPGYNDANLPVRIKQLVTACRQNFSGTKGYEDGWYKSKSWYGSGLGPLAKIYFTLYEPWYNFQAQFDQIANYFGKKAEIGELSTVASKRTLNYNEEDWTRELMRRYDYARKKGLNVWLFNFREPQNDGYGFFDAPPSQQYHAIWDYLRGRKVLSYADLLAFAYPTNNKDKSQLVAGDFDTQVLPDVTAADYVFRGIATPLTISGTESWRAMRLVFRYSNADNYYFLNIEPNDHKVKLFRRQNGVETRLGEVTTPVDIGKSYDFEIRVSGSGATTQIAIFWDTVKIINVVDTGNTNLDASGFGMHNNGVSGEVNALSLTSFEQSECTGAC